ncbi:MAG: AAA family ATPase [Bacilli bacterium]|nr:AAA family ATPase [Bacilli bacterium]
MLILVGASASGKTEIAKRLGALYGIKKVVTHTSRLPRKGEVNHIDYHFVSPEEFLALKKEDAFVETTYYNGNYYGCSKKEIAKNKVVVVDPNGLASFLALHDPSIIAITLVCDEKVRFHRMKGRGDEEDSIIQRIATDKVDFSNPILKRADFTIDTSKDSIESLTNRIYDLYQSEYEKRIGD